jgi:hypothetical protein
MMRNFFARTALVVLAGAWLSGCYTYRPVETAPVGTPVRVHIPVSSSVDIPGRQSETVAVEGSVLALGDSVVVATETRRQLGAYRDIVQLDTLRLGAAQVTRIEVKEFSKGRSIALGLVIAAAVGGAAAVAFGVGGGSTGTGPPDGGGPQGAVVITPSILSGLIGALSGGH